MENELPKSECQWIPVSERLPEDRQEVLISISGEVFMCYYEETSWIHDESDEFVPRHAFIIKCDGSEFIEGQNFPTHWMPIPEPA